MNQNWREDESQRQVDDEIPEAPSTEYQFSALLHAVPEPERSRVLDVLRALSKWPGSVSCLVCLPPELLEYKDVFEDNTIKFLVPLL